VSKSRHAVESKPAAAKPPARSDVATRSTVAKANPPEPEVRMIPPVAVDKASRIEAPAVKKIDARKDAVAAKADAKPTGSLEFWINPWGDVFIDGKQIGTAPPLKVHALPVGTHQLEIYNDSAGFPFKETVEIKAGETLRINRTFR
jgi:serine/threonine-protein kinase